MATRKSADSEPATPPACDGPRRTERGEARRRALIEAAREMFMERGYEGASIEDLVARVGGSKASLYSYFGSKEGLFLEIVMQDCDRFLSDLQIPDHADEDLAGSLRRIGRNYLQLFIVSERRDLFRIVVAEMRRFPELAQRFYAVGPQRGHRALGAYLKLQQAAGRLDCPDVERAASQFFELVKSKPHIRAMLGLPPFADNESVDAHIAEAVQLFLFGCAKPALRTAR